MACIFVEPPNGVATMVIQLPTSTTTSTQKMDETASRQAQKLATTQANARERSLAQDFSVRPTAVTILVMGLLVLRVELKVLLLMKYRQTVSE